MKQQLKQLFSTMNNSMIKFRNAVVFAIRVKSVVFKIVSLLLLTSLISIMIGLVGWAKINEMNSMAEDIFTTNSTTLFPLDDFLQDLYNVQKDASRAVLQGNSGGISALSGDINIIKGQLGSIQNALPADSAKELQTKWDHYERATGDLYNELSHNGPNTKELFGIFQEKSDDLYVYCYTQSQKLRIVGLNSFSKGKRIYESAIILQLVITILGILVAILLGFWIALSIIRPLQQLKNKTDQLAQGNLKVQVSINSKDEISQVGHAFNKAVEELRTMVTQSNSYARDVNVSCDELFRAVKGASVTMENISQLVEDLTRGASTQTENVDDTISSVHKATTGANTVIEATLAIDTMCKEASKTTQYGSEAVTEMITTIDKLVATVNQIDQMVQELSKDSKQILELSDVIGVIADQTKLLSLNASIEAARASENSQGFSVIADHVGRLAVQSDESAHHINKVVKAILQKIDQAAATAKSGTEGVIKSKRDIIATADVFKEVISRLGQITDRIEHIAQTTTDMGTRNATVITEMQAISEISQNNLAAAEQVYATFQEQHSSMTIVTEAARQLRELAQDLSSAANHFEL